MPFAVVDRLVFTVWPENHLHHHHSLALSILEETFLKSLINNFLEIHAFHEVAQFLSQKQRP